MIITSKFDSYCANCRSDIKAGTRVNWIRGVKGVTHADASICADRRKTDEAMAMNIETGYQKALTAARADRPTVTVNAKPMADFLSAARDRGLKFPKVNFLTTDKRTLVLSLAGSTSKYPGSVQVKVDGEWIGRVEPDGNVAGPLSRNATMVQTLAIIAGDPAQAAKAYGAVTGACSFCRRELTDAGSVEVGYGPICADKYGLPHTPKGSAKIEVFTA